VVNAQFNNAQMRIGDTSASETSSFMLLELFGNDPTSILSKCCEQRINIS